MKTPAYSVSITTDHRTGDVISAYFWIHRGKVASTQVYADGAAVADYDKAGTLLGFEILSPCKVQIVDSIAANETPEIIRQTKRFIKNSGPRELVPAV